MNKLILCIPIYLIYVLYFNLLFGTSINIYKLSINKNIAEGAENIEDARNTNSNNDEYNKHDEDDEYNKHDEDDEYNEIILSSRSFSRDSITRKPRREKSQQKKDTKKHKYNQLRKCQFNIISWFTEMLKYIHFPFNSYFFLKELHDVYISNMMISVEILNSNLELCNYKLGRLKSNQEFIPNETLNLDIQEATEISSPFKSEEFCTLLENTRLEIKNNICKLKGMKLGISKHRNSSHCLECYYKSSVFTLLNIISTLLKIYYIMESKVNLDIYESCLSISELKE
ncbi:hypothetical protein ACR3K2_38020 [Cryptosporidium serpentis]